MTANCAQHDDFEDFNPEQMCANLLHDHDAVLAVTALAARTTLPAPELILSHKSWETPGFCGLPGTFCSFEDDVDEVAEPPVTTANAPRADPGVSRFWPISRICGLEICHNSKANMICIT